MPTDEEAAIRDRLTKLAAEGRHVEREAAPWQMSVSRNYRALHGPIMAAKMAPAAAPPR